MAATKNNNRIHTRSPFYINAVPTTGTVTQADLTIRIQTGSRFSAGSMTTLKEYTLTSTNAIDNVIVFNISPLIDDYLDRTTENFDIDLPAAATANECLYVFWDLDVTRTGGTDSSSGYYVGVEGYSKYNEGVNWQPVTTATGNYGNPEWSPATAKGTARTIMATDCYRQIGQDSYAILPIYMGEFDEDNTDVDTFARLAFGGSASSFTNSTAPNTTDYNIQDSDNRDSGHLNNVQYIPIGKKNVSAIDGNWIDNQDYILAGHCVNRRATGSGKPTTTLTLTSNRGTSVGAGGQIDIDLNTELSEFDLEAGDTVTLDLPAFTGVSPCTSTYPARTITTTYSSTVGATTIRVDVTGGAAIEAQVDCFFTSLGEALNFDVTLPIGDFTNDIALVNDNPAIRYEIICEPKYSYVDFFFVNKWGAWDCFTFLKANRENIDVKSETHYKSVGTISGNAYTYDKYDNQRSRFNISAKKSYTVNTGYVDESFSLLLEEILVTPRAFMIWDGVRVPVNVNDSRQELQQHVNDKLINYTLELEAANDYINTAI